jgi:LmbE family N-acetylglucosaminyl deacetylase
MDCFVTGLRRLLAMTGSNFFRLCLGLFCSVAAFIPASAVPEPPALSRIEGLPGSAILQELRSFREMGSVLYVAAHPDDENTQLISYFSRGRGYRTAYLSITRGDGGQNELGPEFGEKLGVARTQELLAARRLDGGRQFFTRAIDFGYSKSPEETLRFWDRNQVLADVVRVIRQFRPDVIVTRFPVPPGSGGHGHHTASAILAVEAFKLAGDPKAYPEQLKQGLTPWQPKRVMWNAWGGARGNGGLDGPTVQLDIGVNDPVTGESFGTIANRSRGMHKTQGLGVFSARDGSGPSVQTFMLLTGDLPGGPARTNTGLAAASNGAPNLMDGVDLTWSRVPGGTDIGRLADEVLTQFKPVDPAASVPALLAIRAKLAALPTDPLVADKRAQLDRVLQACLGLKVETIVPEAEVVPGEVLKLHHTVTVRAGVPVRWIAVRYPNMPYPQDKAPVILDIALVAGQPTTHDSTAILPAGAPLSQPYWLRAEGTIGMFRVDEAALIGRPENPPVFPVEYIFETGGQTLVVVDEPVQLVAGAPEAQARRRLAVIPPVSLSFATGVELFAPGAAKPTVVEVTAARAGARGSVHLEVPAGWKVSPASQRFRLRALGETARFSFTVTAPVHPAAADIRAVADINGAHFDNQRVVFRYDHLPVQLLQPPARLKVVALDLAIRGQRVGYLPGAGDNIAECLVQMGFAVTPLTGADLTPEKLRGLDAVVIGVRAFNERADLAGNLPGLFAWVEAGGTVLAQYNRPNGLKTPRLGPYDLSIAGDAPRFRVTDENSPVAFLAPGHPLLNTPNQITAADFSGWVQERGAYFPSTWDEAHYTPVLAMNDPGEAPLKSSLLVARHGKGYFVYTGLAFFRQLPAGVPGAYRLFANLLSLGK